MTKNKGRFVKGNRPWNKAFICKFCGKWRPLEDFRVAHRFFPPVPCCRKCWKLLG